MKKKGISPLIATVLIIGFTVAITGVIMTWGKSFIQEKTQTEGAVAEARMACISIDFTVDKICKNTDNKMEITLRNTKSDTIDGFSFRSIYLTDIIEYKTELKGLATETITLDITKTLETLDIVPLQKSADKYQPCSSQMKTVRTGTLEPC
ncbi:MAG: archaellin/type IV pilin N-terminal domain-containing protein [archaeon]